jgi:anti-sigma B factor antagonist
VPEARAGGARLSDITIRSDSLRPEVELRGELDLSNVREIAEEITAIVENRALVLIVDLSKLGYIDSTGVGMLFRIARQLRERQQQMILVVPPDALIRSVLTLSAMETVASIEPTIEAARCGTDRRADPESE